MQSAVFIVSKILPDLSPSMTRDSTKKRLAKQSPTAFVMSSFRSKEDASIFLRLYF